MATVQRQLTSEEYSVPENTGPGILEFAARTRAEASALLGDRFVEMWTTESQDGFVVGALDLLDDEARALEAKLSVAVRVSVVERFVSRSELDHFKDEVIKGLGGLELSSVSPNYEQGTVTVGVTDDTDLDRAADLIKRTTGESALSVTRARTVPRLFDFTDVVGHPRVAVIHQGKPSFADDSLSLPLTGGKRISSSVGGCTTSFVVSGAGGNYVLTAGHCGPNGTHARLGYSGPAVGDFQNNTYWGLSTPITADATVVHVGTVNWQPWVYVDPSAHRLVVAQADAYLNGDPATPYAWTCFTGATTVTSSCGYITSTNATTWSGGNDGISHRLDNQIAVLWTSGPGVLHGDSGGPLYGVVADGSAVGLGLLTQCEQITSGTCLSGGTAWFTKIGQALGQTGTALITQGRPPFGWLDLANGGIGTLHVRGWAFDPDLSLTATAVHVYVGGPAGSGAPGYALAANTYRPDVASAYPNTGSYHGYDATITTSVRGNNVPIYVYAIDIGGNYVGNQLLQGAPRYVNIS